MAMQAATVFRCNAIVLKCDVDGACCLISSLMPGADDAAGHTSFLQQYGIMLRGVRLCMAPALLRMLRSGKPHVALHGDADASA